MNKLNDALKVEQLRLVLTNVFEEIDDDLFDFVLPLMEWVELQGNQYLFQQGDIGNSLYLLISGRMQAIVKDIDNRPKVVGEISRGETVGEMALLTDEPRSAGVRAVRDSHLVRITRPAFEEIAARYPKVNTHITKLIIARLKKNNTGERTQSKVANIALVPLSPNINIQHFSEQLEQNILTYGKVLNLSSSSVNQLFDDETASLADSKSDLYHRFSNWLDHQEYEKDFLLFQADFEPSEWTKRCLREADEVLLIADANVESKMSKLEASLLNGENKLTSAAQVLVLLHSDNNIAGTHQWLIERDVKAFHHIRQKRFLDIAKMARILTGNSSGLVLGGGGARGLAHIGVYKALKEYGVPIDMVGGTSIGSIVGSLIALDNTAEETYKIAKSIFMSNPTPISDYNFIPLISLLSGRKINKILKNTVGDIKIEDMPISFFCVSANLTRTETAIHQKGMLRKAVRASMSLPGIFPPAIIDKDLHVDGGLFNDLPIDVMEDMGAGYTIAIDLDKHSEEDIDFDKMPSGWQFLSSKLFKKTRYNVPNIMTTLIQSSTINSLQKIRSIRSRADLYFHPKVSSYGLMDWKKFQEIVDIGYQDAVKVLNKWNGFS